MSELTDRLRRMLAQTQVFVGDAPMEAVARGQLLVREANAALSVAGDVERDEVHAILQLARKMVAKYEARVATFQTANAERAALLHRNEMDRLARPLPAKV
jgi:hypothetical protein